MNKYKKYTLWLIFAITILKLFAAAMVGLGNDEVYYWTYALFPDWSHFDHPPMVGIMLQFFTLNLKFDSEVALRLGSILFGGLTTWVLFLLIAKISNQKAAWIGSILYNSSIYTGIISGWMVMPDSYLVLFWTSSLLFLSRSVTEAPNSKTGLYFMYFAIFAGLAMLSKYHSVILWGGAGLYIMLYNRAWFQSIYLYLSIIITGILFSPVVYWNVTTSYSSFAFHSERVGFFDGGLRLDYFGLEIFGEVIYQNPFVYILILVSLIAYFKGYNFINPSKARLLLLIALPMIAVFWGISIFHRTLPHWTGPAFINLIILSAVYIEKRSKKVLNTISLLAFALFIFVIVGGVSVINFYPGTISPFTEKNKLGKGDVTLDMFGWEQIQTRLKSAIDEDGALFIASKWYPAAHIDYYVATPNNWKLITIGPIKDTHKYEQISNLRGNIKPGDSAYFLTFSNYYKNPNEIYKSKFASIGLVDSFQVFRFGAPVKNIELYKLNSFIPD